MRHTEDTPTVPTDEETILDHEAELYGDELAPGTRAGEYVIGGLIAQGGCGNVYFAEHRLLRRRAAVKVLHRKLARSQEMVRRFIREARAVNVIRHPNIVDIYDFGQLPDGRPYLVMELLQGRSIDSLRQRIGRFSPEEVLDLVAPVCEALSAAHDAGIVHRDLKASNVMVVKTPEGGRALKLLDFGIAKLLEPDAGSSWSGIAVPQKLGTPLNMAPEQFLGDEVDARTDVYALGVLLYQMLTGEYPFDAENPNEIERLHLEAAAPPPSKIAPVSPPLDAVVLRCLEKDPARRFGSVGELLDALRAAVATHRAARAGAVRCEAVGVLVETHLDLETPDDDALIEDVAHILAAADAALRGAGFSVPLRSGVAVVGAIALDCEPNDQERRRQHAYGLAAGLREALARREGADPRVHVRIAVRIDNALCSGGRPCAVLGGKLLDVSSWPSSSDV